MEFITPAHRKVELRAMKVEEEDILTTQQYAKEGKMYDMVLDNCVKSEYPVKKMLVGERVFLIIKLRTISFEDGHIYKVKLNCGSCTERFEAEINMDDLRIQMLDKKKIEIIDGVYQFKVPALKTLNKNLICRLLTGDDENRIRQIRKNNPKEVMSRVTLLKIKEIEGEKVKNVNMIKEMSSRDSFKLRQICEDHDCGVDTDIEVSCPHCLASQDVSLPIEQPQFFFPKVKKN